MRTILGPAATALGRRGLALERAAMVTLQRDAYADPPGPRLSLAIGERTTYRPGAWVLDTFERAALGDTYTAWGGSAGLTLGPGGVTTAVGAIGMATHPTILPRDAWAAVRIGTLSGDAEVGVLLRAAAPTVLATGYRVTATPTLTGVERLDAGVATSLASVATPWRAGAMLRAVWAWDALRVYQDAILVAQVTDATRLLAGQAGMVVRRGDGAAAATITAFLGGEARQEWLGAGLDLGDVQRALGQPATFALTLSNVAPMGGADRFAALLRHGLNTMDTYDLDRGAVRVLTVVDGQSPPLTAGVGLIDGVAEITEDRVQLACRGRDAFLTPQLAAGPVTYLPGPAPGGLTPLPADPCAPSPPPVIEAGAIPSEPVTPAPPPEGLGPEAPPDAGGGGDGGAPTLLGAWLVAWDYTLGTGPLGAGVYVGSTTVTQIPPGAHAAAGYTDHDFFRPDLHFVLGDAAGLPTSPPGTAAFPGWIRETWIYRGPDLAGTDLVPNTHVGTTGPPPSSYPITSGLSHRYGGSPTGSGLGLTFTLARYVATQIATPADLAALRPPYPSESTSPLPARIETLRTWAATVEFGGVGVLWDAAVPTNQFAGPQLLRLECASTAWAGGGGPTRYVEAALCTYTTGPGGMNDWSRLWSSDDVDGTMLGATLGA